RLDRHRANHALRPAEKSPAASINDRREPHADTLRKVSPVRRGHIQSRTSRLTLRNRHALPTGFQADFPGAHLGRTTPSHALSKTAPAEGADRRIVGNQR